MVQKKVERVIRFSYYYGRDIAVNQMLISSSIDFGVTIYNIVTKGTHFRTEGLFALVVTSAH